MRELLDLADYLSETDVLVSDRPDPNSEVYSVSHRLLEKHLDEVQTILLPDRNIVSRMAQVARGEPLNEHRRVAAAVLAFAQCLDIQIEPSIAFHEMAFNEGNSATRDELAWFRVADNGSPHEWVKAGLGAVERLPTVRNRPDIDEIDLAKPVGRWRRNYIVAMKMAELELDSTLGSYEKVSALLGWMRDDFILAGPAVLLAFLYFAPNSPPRRRLLKGLRSEDRQVALAGVKNAAWDITYLSDFARRINEAREDRKKRYIFATADKRLRDLARFAVGEHEDFDANEGLAKSFERWWNPEDAQKIADLWVHCRARIRSQEWWDQYKDRPDYVGELIARGEAVMLSWQA